MIVQDKEDTLHMQIKLQDLSNGLNIKDIVNHLTKSYHVSPSCFLDLCLLLMNFWSVCLVVFGANSLLTLCLEEWTEFLGCDSNYPTLSAATTANDPMLPAKVS